MNKSLQGRFREVIHNNYILYYFVYMYTQICHENALIWGFLRRMFRPPPTCSCVKAVSKIACNKKGGSCM